MSYLKNRKYAFGYAFKGIYSFFKEEAHSRLHLGVFILVLLAGFYFHITRIEWFMVLVCAAMVFGLEMLNSALERALDQLHPEQNESIGKAKDLAAGAVLVVAIISILIGGMIFLPYLF